MNNKRKVKKMARVIKTPENETQCKTCKCRIEYFHEDIYEYQNSFMPSMIFQYIKCPACGCEICVGDRPNRPPIRED